MEFPPRARVCGGGIEAGAAFVLDHQINDEESSLPGIATERDMECEHARLRGELLIKPRQKSLQGRTADDHDLRGEVSGVFC